MISVLQKFTRRHALVFVGFYVAFAILTLIIVSAFSSDRSAIQIFATAAGTISGPFTGAISRSFQSCCLKFSLAIFPYCAAFLMLGVLSQIIPLPLARAERAVKMTLWGIGLLGWFGGALLSFGHALS